MQAFPWLRRLTVALIVLCVGEGRSAAEPALRDPAAAQALFEAGKGLFTAGRYDDACPKFEESYRADPSGGSALHLALCHEAQGRIATAWADFALALSMAQRDARKDREKIAREHIASLEPRLPKLTIVVPPSAEQAQGLTIQRDAEPVGRAQWGVAVPVDPGRHEIVVHLPGRKSWKEAVAIEVGAPRTVSIPDPASLEAEMLPTAAVAPTLSQAQEGRPAPVAKTAAYVAAGAGVVGIGIGAVFGGLSMSKHSEADSHCKGPHGTCDPQGVAAGDSAISDGNISTAGFAIGAGGLAAAAVLWLVAKPGEAPRSVAVTPFFEPTGGGAGLRGTW